MRKFLGWGMASNMQVPLTTLVQIKRARILYTNGQRLRSGIRGKEHEMSSLLSAVIGAFLA